MPSVFLEAEWRDLIIASYAVEPALLEDRVPRGLVLDRFEGRAVCSLVGFRFLNTRVKGLRWPGFVNFPEFNLRFYVREEASGRRGVVFVRELVPSRFVSFVARTVYNEPYAAARFSQRIEHGDAASCVEYGFAFRGGVGRLAVSADAETWTPDEASAEHWFKEHQWGYGVTRRGRTLRYEVRHPVWACRRVRSWEIDMDWGRVYGPAWSSMRDAEPLSVVLAEGSAVEVFGAERL